MKIGNAAILAAVILLAFMLSYLPVIVGAQKDRFTVGVNGIATDIQTGFQRVAGADQDVDWQTAKQWVESLELDGGGWRMPKVAELQKLFEFGAPDFIPYEGMAFWSGYTVDPSAEEIWVYSPEMGFEAPVPPFVAPFNRVLAVRGETPKVVAVKKDYQAANYFYDQGMALRSAPEGKAGKFSSVEAALDYFSQAIDADPAFVKAYNYRGAVYIQLKQWEQALEDFNQALRLDDRYAVAMSNRGICLLNMGRTEEAKIQFDLALLENPGLASAYHGRGLAHIFTGDKSAGCLDATRACELGMCRLHKARCR